MTAEVTVSYAPGTASAFDACTEAVQNTDLSAADIVRRSLLIAGGLDIYTNQSITVEAIECP